MSRARLHHDGLPFRVYERFGKRFYSIGYKQSNNQWAFRYSCLVNDIHEMRVLRHKAITESLKVQQGAVGRTEMLIDAWFRWQTGLPLNDLRRRAASTLKENAREAINLKLAFGHIDPAMITKTDGYAYLDACAQAARPIKGNKEIALLQVILEYGVRIGRINHNPLSGIRKNKTVHFKRYVSDSEMALAVSVGKKLGGSCYVVALALKTAWLCLRRSVEVRGITIEALGEEGILWQDGKSKTKPAVLIQWTHELRTTIDEVLAIQLQRIPHKTHYIFGNSQGARYTTSGWKTILGRLMKCCVEEAIDAGIAFTPFSLQDCRPKGVSDKLSLGQTDTQTATGHTSHQMIQQVYDRRMIKKAMPVK